ncbi:L,D-transpeptidase [Sphingomonas sp. SM33]|uniref:L,D-transpeptidase n=1 Tax=Sphingomonas telluris TaxID=2907998 RepID=A0ABS9VIL7_9SPHN|nr:L,D-transpeptidase [Sphingomonas telluris]MCH8614815.1 L,D-transpeptidase [Sphingomonas telluris]
MRFAGPPACAFLAVCAASPVMAQMPSAKASQVIGWVASTGDARGRPFMIIDKVGAEIFVYDRTGRFMGSTPALVGSTRGDHEVVGIGDRELSDIKPSERTTPAGRYVAIIGPSNGLGRVLWIDIPGAVALHPVITNHPQEHRVERLRSETPADNRITYGCINISPMFYENVVRPLFTSHGGVVYILPEKRSLASTFPGYRVQ